MAATVYFLVAYLARTWSSVASFDWTFIAGWLALSAAAFLLFYFAAGRGSGGCSSAPCGAEQPVWPAASMWGKSILARYIPGNVFMFVGRAWMSHDQGLPLDRVTAAMVYEQALRRVLGARCSWRVLFPFWEWHRGSRP